MIPAAQAGVAALRREDNHDVEHWEGVIADDVGTTVLLNHIASPPAQSWYSHPLHQSGSIHICYLNMEPISICLKRFILFRVKCFIGLFKHLFCASAF